MIVIWTQVLYNAAAVYSRMGHWDRAEDVLVSVGQERAGSRIGAIEVALESVLVSAIAFQAQHHIHSVSVSIQIRDSHKLNPRTQTQLSFDVSIMCAIITLV